MIANLYIIKYIFLYIHTDKVKARSQHSLKKQGKKKIIKYIIYIYIYYLKKADKIK